MVGGSEWEWNRLPKLPNHHFGSASRILKPRLSLTHSHREFQARGFVNKSLSLFNVFNFLVWSVFIKSDTSEWHVLLSNQKIIWNGSRTQRHLKQDLWNAAHRLNRKLFFRPCQCIRAREKTEKGNKNRFALSSFFLEAGSIYTAAQSFYKRTDVCSPFFPFVFSTHNWETSRRCACVPLLFWCTQRVFVRVFLLPVYFCHRWATTHFRRAPYY